MSKKDLGFPNKNIAMSELLYDNTSQHMRDVYLSNTKGEVWAGIYLKA